MSLPHGTVGWSSVCVIVVFPGHIHLLFVFYSVCETGISENISFIGLDLGSNCLKSLSADKQLPHGAMDLILYVSVKKFSVRIKCLAQGHNPVPPVRLNLQSFYLESSTLL